MARTYLIELVKHLLIAVIASVIDGPQPLLAREGGKHRWCHRWSSSEMAPEHHSALVLRVFLPTGAVQDGEPT
jgi:hypothetical protein